MLDMHDCQPRVHAWGRANRMVFDAHEEDTKVIRHVFGDGSEFRYLGVQANTKLWQ